MKRSYDSDADSDNELVVNESSSMPADNILPHLCCGLTAHHSATYGALLVSNGIFDDFDSF